MMDIVFPAEWYPQSAVLVTWPHNDTDWVNDIEQVTDCYVVISKEILKRQKLLVVCRDAQEVKRCFSLSEQANLICVEVRSNDTWARDHGPIALFVDEKPVIADFGFNGWGLKFAANHDNRITENLYQKKIFSAEVAYRCNLDFIMEGGSIESDGNGTVLTTAQCLLAPNRNQPMTQNEIEAYLKRSLGAKRILWLRHGYLAGDDTDSHIDTLARFCNEETIAYVQCDDPNDEHYEELQAMERELKAFVKTDGKPYHLVALPMANPVYCDGERLPATYANFLIINNAVLLPFYGSEKDEQVKEQLRSVFPDREIIGIDCNPLIRQHGSLHCITMQLPIGFF